MSVYKFSDNTIVSKPKPYGMDYSSVIHNYFITNFTDYFNNKSFNQKYLLMCKFNTKIFYLTKENSNRIYASAAGTYCTILNFDFFKKFVLIKLPSKKQLFLNYSYLAYTGRNSNIFYKYQYFNSFSKKFITKSKRPSVRGIAKNPVDHPNGGRSKVKKPFKTP